MNGRESPLDLAAAGYFVLRTPLLPLDALESWSTGLQAPSATSSELPAALAADRRLLRRRLLRLAERPEIREALFVAAPNLEAGLAQWRREPDGKKGSRAEAALVRYVQRMASRATPFGLFAGCSVGRVSEQSRLALGPLSAYRRHTRLDTGYLATLCASLERDPDLRRQIAYRPNSSLYRSADRWCYVETRYAGPVRLHDLVAVDASPFLERALERTAAGATLAELAAELVRADPELTEEEAEEFAVELIEAGLLVSDLEPPVTGSEAIEDIVGQLSTLAAPPPACGTLAAVGAGLAALDAGGLGADPESYLALARELEGLPAAVDLSRLFQVDMFKPPEAATLGAEVFDEVARGVGLLRRLLGGGRDNELALFRTAFRERYDGRSVPLLEALDEATGIGFQHSASPAPLLAGLPLDPPPADPTVAWGPFQRWLLGRLASSLAAGDTRLEIGDADVEGLSRDTAAPLPDALQVLATVAARSAEHLAGGDFAVHLRVASGPGGSQMNARFCHADPVLRELLEAQLRAEEALQPGAVFAEVVHLPQGRLGNVLSRPVLRGHEIPFLGRSGAPPDRQISVGDLLVSLAGDEVVLISARSGRRVVPRLSSAHNFTQGGLGVYRFLCALQGQGVTRGLGWQWGPFDDQAFLPRVTSGRLVLARARWRIGRKEIQRLAARDPAAGFSAARELRRERGLPRRVLLVDRDNELLVDFDNVLSVESFAGLARRRSELLLTELFPGLDELCVHGPEGRFTHELVIPFLRRREPTTHSENAPRFRLAAARTFAPGSEWLYARLFTGSACVDRLLGEVVAPLARDAIAAGAADGWFYVRYSDPSWHLRLRFHGEPERLRREVLPRLQAAAAERLGDGRIWRFSLETYEREIERYGGEAGIDPSERLAHVDSEAALELVALTSGEGGADARWRLAFASSARLLEDLGFSVEARLEIAAGLARSFERELPGSPALRQALGERLRRERAGLEDLLARVDGLEPRLAAGVEVLDRRSVRLAPIAAELRSRERAGRLTVPLSRLAASYLHMSVNRLLPSDARVHERVLYDFLDRILRSRLARGAGRRAAPGLAAAR